MKTIDKILTWLIVAAIVAVIATQVISKAGQKSKIALTTLSLSEAQESFPSAIAVHQADTSLFLVTDADGNTLGTILFSAPYSDKVRGYAGKMPLKIVLDKDGKILNVVLLANKETPRFINHVKEEGFFDSWTGLTPEQALNKNVDAVNGATFSSNGIKQSLKERLTAYTLQEDALKQDLDKSKWLADGVLLLVLALALVCFFFLKNENTQTCNLAAFDNCDRILA
jgi:FMN-binding domain.